MTPTFSIIIPVYNVAPYLRECLDSVLAAAEALGSKGDKSKSGVEVEERMVEIICVDDGSTDGSGAILDEYAERNEKCEMGNEKLRADKNSAIAHFSLLASHFKVIHQPNEGVSAARNAALDVATGDWLVFLDADDVIVGDALKILHETLRTDAHADMIRFDYRKFDEGEKLPPQSLKDGGILREDISKTVPDRYMDSYMWQYAVRRSFSRSIRFKPYIGGEDRLFIAECMARAGVVLEIDKPLYGYRQRSTSSVHAQMSFRKLESELGYMLDLLSVCRNAGKKMSFLSVAWARRFLCGAIIVVSMQLNWREGRTIWSRWRKSIPFLLGFPEIRGVDRIKLLSCQVLPFYAFAIIVCYAVPRLWAGGNLENWMKRKMYGK